MYDIFLEYLAIPTHRFIVKPIKTLCAWIVISVIVFCLFIQYLFVTMTGNIVSIVILYSLFKMCNFSDFIRLPFSSAIAIIYGGISIAILSCIFCNIKELCRRREDVIDKEPFFIQDCLHKIIFF